MRLEALADSDRFEKSFLAVAVYRSDGCESMRPLSCTLPESKLLAVGHLR